MDLTTGFLLLLIGILAGGYGTIVGAGGGFIFVPALLLLFKMEPAIAAGSGLIIVLINSLSGVVGYAKQEKIQYRTGLTLAIGALPGSFLGVWLLQLYSSSYFYVIFATLLVGLGIFLFTKNLPDKLKRHQPSDGYAYIAAGESSGNGDTLYTADNEDGRSFEKWLIPLGLVIGILSSYLGIGGGWLLVPILIYVFKVPTHNAAATSIFSLCLYSTIGVIAQLFYGHVDWPAVIFGGIGVIVGSQIGVLLSQKIPGKVIIQMLSVLLIFIGVRMYFS